MKKTKTILGLMTALGLLFMAACEQGISPTAPDLGDFHDARTNTAYTNPPANAGGSYFPSITFPKGNLNGGRITAADKNGYVEINFGSAVTKAQGEKKTLDILNGDAAANIKAAIVFEGVKYVANADIPATAVPGGPPYNDYTPLTYTVTAVDRNKAYIELPDLAAYHAVRAHIKASAYKISGYPIDTDGNLAGGEDPYDDYYGDGTPGSSQYYLLDITDGAATAGVTDRPTTVPGVPFVLDTASAGLAYETSVAMATYYVPYSYFNYDTADYSGLKDYFKLEKWNADSRIWADSGIAGQYATTGFREGQFYFSLPLAQDTYDRYRIVAVNLHRFETGVVWGFKHRFSTYPGTNEPVLAKDGRKVLRDDIIVVGANYLVTHVPFGNLFTSLTPEADEQGRNVVLVLDVNTTVTGNLGLKPFPADINGNFKLAYNVVTVAEPLYKYIPITRAVVRQTPGTPAQQQLVLTLDPGYIWTNVEGKTIEIYAREGIGFAGNGSLGDKNGTINIDGHYDWGLYGTFPF